MAKLFNTIRKKLINDKPSTARTTNYLKYAIGEIVLVVIGILIALQINNWNQEQQQKKVLKNIYATIKADLQQDIKNIDKIVNGSQPIEKEYLAIINKTRKKEDFKNCKNCIYVNFGFPEIKLRKNGSELLQNYNQQNSTPSNSLSIKLNSLYLDLTNDIAVDLNELATNTSSFLEIVKYTQPWFADLNFRSPITYTDAFIEYALTDFGYRNTTKVLYEMYYKGYIPDLKQYKTNSLEIIALIDKKLVDE